MDFASARTKMVDNQIRTTDVTDPEILRAFLEVPRERFVPAERRDLAYIGAGIPLGRGRSLMEAPPLAKLLQLATVRPGERALVVGAGTGYACAILAALGAKVTGLDADAELLAVAREALADVAADVDLVEGPMTEGHAAGAPYDIVLLEGAVDFVPDALFSQIGERGRLLAVIGHGNAGMAKLYVRDGDVVSDRFGFNCSLDPLPGFRRTPTFTF